MPRLIVLPILFVMLLSIQLRAQPNQPEKTAAQVEVTAVKFGTQRYGRDTWLEVDVELLAKPGGRANAGEFVNRVRATLTVAFEATDARGLKKNTFYRTSVEAIAIEGGARSSLRFYLPPEVVKRDKLRTDADYYVVELEAAGEPQPAAKPSASQKFTSLDSVKNFLTKAQTDAVLNDGLLMPQYLTPFAGDPQKPTPTLLRREYQR